MHLFFWDTRIKSEGTKLPLKKWWLFENGKRNKNCLHSFRGKLSDNKLAKFQLNWLRGYRLGVENVRLTFQNFCFKKTRKVCFLGHLTGSRIITPDHPCWCLPERDHLAITRAFDRWYAAGRCTIYRERPAFFRATGSFRSGTETSKRNQVRFTS